MSRYINNPNNPSDFEPSVRFRAAAWHEAAQAFVDRLKGKREGRATGHGKLVRAAGSISPIDVTVAAQEDEIKETINYKYDQAEEKVWQTRRSAEVDKEAAEKALVELRAKLSVEVGLLKALGHRERGRSASFIAVTLLCFVGQLVADTPTFIAASFIPVIVAVLIAIVVGGLFAFGAHETAERVAEKRDELRLADLDDRAEGQAWRRFVVRHGWLPLTIALGISWWRLVNFSELIALLKIPTLQSSVMPINALLLGVSVGTYVLAVLVGARYLWHRPVAQQHKMVNKAGSAVSEQNEKAQEAERVIRLCDETLPYLARRRATRIEAIERRKVQRHGRVDHAREMSRVHIERKLDRENGKSGSTPPEPPSAVPHRSPVKPLRSVGGSTATTTSTGSAKRLNRTSG